MVAVTSPERKVKKKLGVKKKKAVALVADQSAEKKKKKKKKSVAFVDQDSTVQDSIDAFISNIRQETAKEVSDGEINKDVTIDDEDVAMKNEEDSEVKEESEDEQIEEEITNAKEHRKLLKNFGVEERKRKIKERVLPVQPSEKEIEGKLTVNDLMVSAKKQEGLKAVQQLLEGVKETKTLEEPLPRFQQEQAEREVNYDKSKKEVSKWLPLVKRNRESRHMAYPLYHTQATKIKEDISSFANKTAAPTSQLEQEIYEVLSAESHVLERDDQMLTEAEERSLEQVTAEEAELRREELCKMRALLSYQEEKFRRKNKIKSKKYHKLLKKERQKKEERALSGAVKANPDVAESEMEKADYLRALERISQKHKVGGKWNKNLLHKKIQDPDLKHAMSEQRQLRQKLMEKQDLSEEEGVVEEEEGVVEEETAAEEQPQEEFEVDPNNPWLAMGSMLSGETELPKQPAVAPAVAPAAAPVTASDKTGEEEGGENDQNEASEEEGQEDMQGSGKEEVPGKKSIGLDQEALIDMAFANDDVVAQFVEEKEKIVDEETEKEIDVTLPGWGSWAGAGTSDKPKKRIVKEAKPTAPRKDAGLQHVIINTKKNRKLDQHLVRRLPHPYKSRTVFEREMRQPIGPQWNSIRSFRDMIKPSHSVVDGKVIEPMVAPKGFENVVIRGKRKG